MRKLLLAAAAAGATVLSATGTAAAASPSITVTAATGVTTSSAQVHASITPGGAQTYYSVQYGLTAPAYTNATSVYKLPSTTATRAVTLTLSDLQPGTIYHYRFNVINRFGGVTTADHAFKTTGNPPADVSTGAALVTGSTSATLTGVVNPQGQTTRYFFQYGPSNSLPGLQTPAVTLPASHTAQTVSFAFPTGTLTPGTTYLYRLVATHAGPGGNATSNGMFQSFLTFPAQRSRPGVHADTRPHRILERPFVLFTSGYLRMPSGIPSALGCPQNGRLTIVYGRHRITDELVEVGANCHFTAQTTIGRLPRQHGRRHAVVVRVYIHFPGNGYVAPASARVTKVRLGS